MKKAWKRIRGALGMGVTWAVGWALGGLVIGVSSLLMPWLPLDWFFEIFDAPLPALAIPGFVAGTLFSVVLGTAGRRRRFDELSLPRFAAWGAAGGLLLSLVPHSMIAAGLATFNGSNAELWKTTAIISVPFMVLGAVSASVSLLVARRAQDRGARSASEDGDEVALAEEKERALLEAETGPSMGVPRPERERAPARTRPPV